MIATALRSQIREVHDFFADVIRDGQAARRRRTPTATRSPRRGSSSRGGLLATIDSRLGGLLGDDLERVRAERRRWMLAPAPDDRPQKGKAPAAAPGALPGQAGRRLGDSEVLGPAAQPVLSSAVASGAPLHSSLASGRGARWAHCRTRTRARVK